jgi:hypothetical protein
MLFTRWARRWRWGRGRGLLTSSGLSLATWLPRWRPYVGPEPPPPTPGALIDGNGNGNSNREFNITIGNSNDDGWCSCYTSRFVDALAVERLAEWARCITIWDLVASK